MDDDPVLRSLADDLEREDPRLAALLDGRPHRRGHPVAWWLAGLVLLGLALLLPLGTTLGLLGMLAILGSPLAACWLISASEGPVAGRP